MSDELPPCTECGHNADFHVSGVCGYYYTINGKRSRPCRCGNPSLSLRERVAISAIAGLSGTSHWHRMDVPQQAARAVDLANAVLRELMKP